MNVRAGCKGGAVNEPVGDRIEDGVLGRDMCELVPLVVFAFEAVDTVRRKSKLRFPDAEFIVADRTEDGVPGRESGLTGVGTPAT